MEKVFSTVDKLPLISVVVPVYNVEKYLNRCVESIKNQTYENLEIILVDDGSPDKCPKLCDDFKKNDKRIKVIHKKNGGLSDARNRGIDIAKGKYITFIDSDDYVKKEYVELLYHTLKKFNSDISICSHSVEYENGSIIDKSCNIEKAYSKEEALENMMYGKNIDTSSWGKLFKIELFNKIRFPINRLFEDSATTYLLFDLAEKISYSGKSMYFYEIRNDSITSSNFNSKKMDLIISTKEMYSFIERKYPKLIKAAKRRLMYSYLSTLTQMIKSKNVDKNLKNNVYTYIKKNRKEILSDNNIPKRDRYALFFSYFGINCFKIIWNVYSKATGRS